VSEEEEENVVHQYHHFIIVALSTKPSELPCVKHLRIFVYGRQNLEEGDEALSIKI
jgi:hypothetical protein